MAVNHSLPTVDFNGVEWPSFNQMCRHYGHAPDTVKKRLEHGWSLKESLVLPDVCRDLEYKCPPDMVEAYGKRREEYKQQSTKFINSLIVTHSAREDNIKLHKAKSRDELSARVQQVAKLMIKALKENTVLESFQMKALGEDYEACEAMIFRCVVCNRHSRAYMFKTTAAGLMYINDDFFESFTPVDFCTALGEIACHGFNGKCKTANGIFVFLKAASELFKRDEEPRDPWLKPNAAQTENAS